MSSSFKINEFDLGAGQVDLAGDDIEAGHRRRDDALIKDRGARQQFVTRPLAQSMPDAETGGGVALGIEVDQ
jgi:hypothetical protein